MSRIRLESGNLVYLAICATALILFVLVGIYPNLNAMRQMDEELDALQKQIDSQALFSPVFRTLIEEIQIPVPPDLPLAQVGRIDQGNLTRLNEIFSALALAKGVILHSAVPDVGSYHDEDDRLIVNAVFSGDFFDFRSLLMEICKLPFVHSIPQLRIETDQDKKRLALKLELLQ